MLVRVSIFLVLFVTSVFASAKIELRTHRLRMETLHPAFANEAFFIEQLSYMSQHPLVLDLILQPFNPNFFIYSHANLEQIKFRIAHGEFFELSMGVFKGEELIGGLVMGSFEKKKFGRRLHAAGQADYGNGVWAEQGLFISPEHQGKGYGKEVTQARLKFLFEHVGVDGVIVTPIERNAISILNSEENGFVRALPEVYEGLLPREDQIVLFQSKQMYFDRKNSFCSSFLTLR